MNKKRTLLKFIFFFFGIVSTIYCNAQGYPNHIDLTPDYHSTYYSRPTTYPPEAASLMRMVDYPVSHLTGTPDIRIPLYTIKAGMIEIPVDLSFHHDNYLRTNQLPGAAGAGWSVSSDLQITRTVNGIDDFALISGGNVGYYHQGSLVLTDYLGGNYDTQIKPWLDSDFSTEQWTLNRMATNQDDTEPDKFYYKLANKSGSFYFEHYKEDSVRKVRAVSVPRDGTKITYHPGSIKNDYFTIVDTDGSTYYFSSKHGDISNSSSTSFPMLTMMSWKCDSIVNALGQTEVKFKYEEKKTIYSIKERREKIEYLDKYDLGYHNTSIWANPYNRVKCYDSDDPISNNNYPWYKMSGPKKIVYDEHLASCGLYVFSDKNDTRYVFHKLEVEAGYNYRAGECDFQTGTTNNYLTEISYRGNTVIYEYINDHILSSIKVKDNTEQIIKTIQFTQFPTNYSTVQTEALDIDRYMRCLNSLRIDDENYSFSYGRGRYAARVTDFWGYGTKDQPTTSGSKIDFSIDIEVLNYDKFFLSCHGDHLPRTFSHDAIFENFHYLDSAEWKLLEITYPTGGRAAFIVEQNRYLKDYFNDEGQIGELNGSGGYRIKRISFYDNPETDIPSKEKIYKYGKNENGGGIPRMVPGPHNIYTEQNIKVCRGDMGEVGSAGWQPGIPQIYDYYNYRKRTYSNTTTVSKTYSNGSTVNYDTVTEYDTENGQISGKTVYVYNALPIQDPGFGTNSSPYFLEREEWDYGQLLSTSYYKRNGNSDQLIHQTETDYEVCKDLYEIYRSRTWTGTEAIWSAGDPGNFSSIEATMKNKSNYNTHDRGIPMGHVRPTKTTETQVDSNGNSIVKETQYVYDGAKDIKPSQVKELLSNGTYTTQHITYPTSYLASPVYGTFINSLLSKNMVDKPIEQVTRQNGVVVSGALNIYNDNGTLNKVRTLNANNTAQASFNLSNRAQGNYDANTSGYTVYNPSSLYEDEVQIENYDKYGNPTSVYYPKKNIRVCYLWSYKGQYPIAQIENCLYGDVITALSNNGINVYNLPDDASPNMSNIDNALRTNTTLKAAGINISTYEYKPLIGMIWAKGANNITVYYDYDSNNRLEKVYRKDGTGNEEVIETYDYHYRTNQ